MLGSLILYLKGMRICMFQLSGFYCKVFRFYGVQGLRFKGFKGLGLGFKVFRV